MSRDNPLNGLEKSGYFYQRGKDTTRLEAFVDAAFAFALTLLVISFDAVPKSFDELMVALRAVPAFLFGFCVLAMFWIAHRNWSMRFGLVGLAGWIYMGLAVVMPAFGIFTSRQFAARFPDASTG